MKSTVTVRNLRQGLASVGRMTDDHQAILLFTSTKVYAIPEQCLRQHLRADHEIGERDDRGLYTGKMKQINKVLSFQRGFQPLKRESGASTTPERHEAEGQDRLYALTVQQETMEQARVQIPGRARSPSGQLGRAGRLQRRDPERTVGVHSLKQTVRGDRPRHPMSIRTLSGGCGAPAQRCRVR